LPAAEGGLLCESSRCRDVMVELIVPLPGLPALIALLLAMRTGAWEAPAAGDVRAITERFCTAEDGLDTCELILAAPSELCGVGLIPTELVIFAFFNEAAVTRELAGLIRWPFMKALRFAVVTA
jgi:hypothetical protein